MRMFLAAALAAVLIASYGETRVSSQTAAAPTSTPALPGAAELERMTARFAPSEVGVDLSQLPLTERQALAKLVGAARLFDGLFLEQVWAGNPALVAELAADTTPLGRARLHYFLINKGPWSRLDHNAPFVPGVPEKPAAANYYPAGATKSDVEKWIASLPLDERAAATGFFTTIRRTPAGGFSSVPYSMEYQGTLARVAELLREAAALTSQPTLKRFLELRADAFLSNDYYASDVAWMEIDASIEPTIGPYEVYEDEWFNYKAAFEAFITIRDEAETSKLKMFNEHLQDLENNLPIDPKLRNPKLGALAPLHVVNVVFSSGEGNSGVQTAAYNLPNDERVVREKGTKRIMLKNIQEAKFSKVLVPIAKVALSPADQAHVSFDAFFTHIVMHEVMHGLGPHNITVGGRQTTVRQELKEMYSAIEEAKADISGLWALQRLATQGVLDKKIANDLYTTFLASAFRSIRFGVNEAHGRGVALQLNTLLDNGAFKVRPDGTFYVDTAKIADAVSALTGEIMTLEANGDYGRASSWLDKMAVVRPEVKSVLDKLTAVPVDIEPRFGSVR
ncbi:MAG: dipeptidyl-peptidase 3 family protein [Acidobacteriota bacterium]